MTCGCPGCCGVTNCNGQARSAVGQKIERDHQRFRKIVRGKVKSEPAQVHQPRRDDRQEGEGPRLIPLPQIEMPQFRYGQKGSGGVGQGDGDVGTAARSAPGRRRVAQGRRPAGRAHPRGRADAGGAGRRSSARSWSCRASSRGARRTSSPRRDRYTGIRQAGPESLRHFKRTFKRALKRQISSGTYDPDDPIVIPIREDKQYRVVERGAAAPEPSPSSST